MGAWAGQNCLLTSALDGNVRVWVPAENPVEGQVVDPTPAYQHPVEDEFETPGKRRVCSFPFASLPPCPLSSVFFQVFRGQVDVILFVCWVGSTGQMFG